MATTSPLRILVVDRSEDFADQVHKAAEQLEPPAEVVACSRVGAVSDLLREETFAVLVAGPSMANRSGLHRVTAIHEDHPAMSIVLAFTERPDASLREIVQAGADDVLRLPVQTNELAEAIERVGEIALRAGVVSLTEAPAPHALVPIEQGPAKVYTVSSATGGCGKTFYATNMALFLARHTRKRVVVVDLDLQFGEVSTALRLRPKYTIYDALHGDADGPEFADHLSEYLVEHEGGFSVLAAPRDPAEADRITPADVTRVLEVLREQADYVVVDTPAALTEIVLAAFDLSEHLFAMCTVDLPSVRNLGVFLQTLEKLRIPTENISLILNKAETDVGLDIGQIVRLFPQGFKSILPYAREVSRSINLGMPVLASNPGAEVSQKLAAGLAEILPDVAVAGNIPQPEPPPATSWWARLFGRARTDLVGGGVQ